VDLCEECGFDYVLGDAENASSEIAGGVAELIGLLQDGKDLGRRRDPSTWSPLEYGCHMRDVLLVQRERVRAARWMDTPSVDPMGRDERVEFDGYADQDPSAVRRQLTDAAFMFANVLDRIPPEEWERTVVYNYPKSWTRSLRWVAVHTVHEVRHHTLDIRRQVQGA
jgi:hypothetical protein